MATQFFIEKYRQPFTGRTFTGVCKFTVPTNCTITKLNFHAPTIAGTGWKFCVRKNGSPITPADPSDVNVVSLGTGTPDVSKTGLSIAAVADDVIQVDLIAFGSGTWTGFEFCLIADDHAGGAVSELSDVDLTGLADGNGLFFDEGSGLWRPGDVPAPPTPALDDLTDVTAPTPADGDGLFFNGSTWVNQPAAGTVLQGDVTGSLGDSKVIGIMNRLFQDIPLPTFLADEFNGSSIGSEWTEAGDGNTSFTEGGGKLTLACTNSGFSKARHILGATTFNFANKTIEFSMPGPNTGFTNNDQILLGIHPHSGGYGFGTNTVADDFIGVIITGNAMIARIAGYLNAAVTGSGTFTPRYFRLRHEPGHIYWDVIPTTGGSWTQVYDYATAGGVPSFSADSLLIQAIFDSGHAASYPLDYVRTDYITADTLADGDFFVWDSTTVRFKKQTAGALGIIPTTTGAPSGAPSGLGTGQTQLRYDQSAHTLYAWNGSTWDNQVF